MTICNHSTGKPADDVDGATSSRRYSDRVHVWVGVVKDLGFPVAVAAYLIWRLDGLLREQTAALWALHQAVERLLVGK